MLEIIPRVTRSTAATRYEYDLIRTTGETPQTVFYEIDDPDHAEPRTRDGILFAIALHAQSARTPVHLAGVASREALLNLKEFQEAWACWLPGRPSPVAITADEVSDDEETLETGRPAISAYSGGVDANFTLHRHKPGAAEPHRPLAAGMVVQGFDISLDNTPAFESVVERTRTYLGAHGLATHAIRTNSRSIRQPWELSFAAQLAGCLHHFSRTYSVGLIGSSEPYDGLVIPWGSSPITDHLLTGADMRAVHDGAGFSRTEKVANLVGERGGLDNLRVCWQGQQQDANCGWCEKCIRTKLNLAVCGVENAPCFPTPFESSDIDRLRLKNPAQVQEIETILQYAERTGACPDWLPRLSRKLDVEKRRVTSAFPLRNVAHRTALRVLASVGLLERAREIRNRRRRR